MGNCMRNPPIAVFVTVFADDRADLEAHSPVDCTMIAQVCTCFWRKLLAAVAHYHSKTVVPAGNEI